MHALMFAIALLSVPQNAVTVKATVITATEARSAKSASKAKAHRDPVWTCGRPQPLATDATATVRVCEYR